MKTFFTRFILFCLLFFVFDKIFILLINYVPRLEVDRRLEAMLKGEVNKELIVLGSSRGARNVIAGQIENETGIESYNLSYPGGDIAFKEFLLRTLIAFNSSPKIVLLVVDNPKELLPENTIYFRLDRLYPLVKYKFIRQELINRGEKNELLSKLFFLYRMNISNFDLRKKKFMELDSMLICGSMPTNLQKRGVNWVYDVYEDVYDINAEVPEKVFAFQNIIKQCNVHHIKLVVLFTADFKNDFVSFEKRIRELGGDRVHYLHYDTTNLVYRNSDYFYDKYHMRKKGAIVFTNEIVKFLQSNSEAFMPE